MTSAKFLPSELSSSSVQQVDYLAEVYRNVAFYGDEYGHLIPLFAGSCYDVAVVNGELAIGIYIGADIYPIYDDQRRQIVVTTDELHHIIMTPEMHQMFDHNFVRVRPHPRHPFPLLNPGRRPRQNRP